MSFIKKTIFGIFRDPWGQPFHFQLFSNREEGVQVFLGQVDLPEIHEGEHSVQVFELDTPQVDHRVAVLDVLQDSPEEFGAGGQHHLVHLDLLVSTNKRQVGEVLVAP